jgi:hypothetical protein
MNVRKRILLAWAEAVGFTILCCWLIAPTLHPRLFGLCILVSALCTTHIQLHNTIREVFKAEPKWLRVVIFCICSLVMVAGVTIWVLKDNFSIGTERIQSIATVLIWIGSLGYIVWFIYEDGRLFLNVPYKRVSNTAV